MAVPGPPYDPSLDPFANLSLGDLALEEPPWPFKVERKYDSDSEYNSDDDVVTVSGTAKEVLKRLQSALASHGELQRSSQNVEHLIQSAPNTSKAHEISSALATNASALANIKRFLDACLDSFPTSMRPTATSHTRAEEVLGTPELLEAILLHVPPDELLGAMRINRAAMHIFMDSPKLLDALQLRPHLEGYLSNTIAENFEGLRVDLESPITKRKKTKSSKSIINKVPVVVTCDRSSDLRIGSRCRSMLIVQPAVVGMKVNVSCCPRHHWSPYGTGNSTPRYDPFGPDEIVVVDDPMDFHGPPVPLDDPTIDPALADLADEAGPSVVTPLEEEKNEASFNTMVDGNREIRCDSGITVGHICDAVQKLREAHRCCPYATITDHDSDGVVKPEISFRATLTLKKHDPYLAEIDRLDICSRLETTEATNKKAIMKIYIDSKKRAHANDWPILTYRKWKLKYEVDKIVGRHYLPYPPVPPSP